MTIAEEYAQFEFNPSAPEFVPREPLSVLEERKWHTPSNFINSILESDLDTACADSKADPDGKQTQQNESSRARRKASLQSSRRPSSQNGSSLEDVKVATLVVKNLPLDLKEDDLARILDNHNVKPMKVDFHHDAAGSFRGTAFVRYESPEEAKVALEKLGSTPELSGRKTRVELQKSKALFGRRSLEAELPQEELNSVREEIERFLNDPTCMEVCLAASFSVYQRKYVHSLAERHNLAHVTQQNDTGEKYVFLSKSRQRQAAPLRGKAHSVHLCDAQTSMSPKLTPKLTVGPTGVADAASATIRTTKGTPDLRAERRKKKASSFCVNEEKRPNQSPMSMPGFPQEPTPLSLPPGLFDEEEVAAMIAVRDSPALFAAVEPEVLQAGGFGEMQPAMLPPGLG